MLLFSTQAEGENEVNNELANRMSLFYAEATPMLKTLSDATTKFVSEVSVVGSCALRCSSAACPRTRWPQPAPRLQTPPLTATPAAVPVPVPVPEAHTRTSTFRSRFPSGHVADTSAVL